MPPLARPDPLMDAYARRGEDLRRLFQARAGATAADDLMQELYLKLAGLRSHAELAEPEAYLFRLAYNLAADHRRSDQRRARREERWTREGFSFLGANSVADTPPADAAAAAREELRRLLAAVEHLPPRTREVFRLHKLEGFSYAEVAQRLSITKSAVEKHMSRALADLARAVRP